MAKFVIKSKWVSEVIDIVEADSPEAAMNLVNNPPLSKGPLHSSDSSFTIETVEEVQDFRDIIKQIHPTITEYYIPALIEGNLLS